VGAERSAPPPGDPVLRFTLAQLERFIARARGDAGAERAAKRRGERARGLLLAAGRGRDEIKLVSAALAAAAPAVRTAAKAHSTTRAFAEQAAFAFVRALREHGLSSEASTSHMLSACAWGALESMLRDRAFALGFSGVAPKDHGPTFAESLKLATQCEASARHARGWALHLEREARDGNRERGATWPGLFDAGPPPADVAPGTPIDDGDDDQGQDEDERVVEAPVDDEDPEESERAPTYEAQTPPVAPPRVQPSDVVFVGGHWVPVSQATRPAGAGPTPEQLRRKRAEIEADLQRSKRGGA
jgi:hypothetical protein